MNWRDQPIVVLDTETCGTDPTFHRVVEVAAVTMERGEITGRFSRLVNPASIIPTEASAIHGITNEMVAGAPTFGEIAVDLAAFCEGHLMAGFNSKFDRAMVVAEYLRAGLVPPSWTRAGYHWLDVLVLSRVWDTTKRAGYHKLGAVAERLGVEVSTAHRALGDCETTARILAVFAAEPDFLPDDWDDLMMAQRVAAAKDELSFLQWLAGKKREEKAAA